MPEPLLVIEDLRVSFRSRAGDVEAVSGVHLTVQRGEFVALVGESGSGKTVTALAIARLMETPTVAGLSGRVLLEGEDLLAADERRLRAVRGGRVAYVFQEPGSALNPVFTVGYQIAEALRRHGPAGPVKEQVGSLLRDVGLDDTDRVARAYPHQLSGGQQQRIMLAMALACDPALLVADEPTTALDVTVQAQVLDLMAGLQARRGMAVLLITHNLAIAARMAQRLYVMYAGQIVETGPSRDVLRQPRHPYTQALLKAVPRLRGADRPLEGIPGQLPSGAAWPNGCRFHPRCPLARSVCREQGPGLVELGEGRASSCWFPAEVSTP